MVGYKENFTICDACDPCDAISNEILFNLTPFAYFQIEVTGDFQCEMVKLLMKFSKK